MPAITGYVYIYYIVRVPCTRLQDNLDQCTLFIGFIVDMTSFEGGMNTCTLSYK